MRLIFMGTPEFAVPSLERLIQDGHDLAAVFTQPDKPAGRGNKLQTPAVRSVALAHGLPVHQPARIKSNEDVWRIFEQTRADACVVAAYGKILPEWLLRIPRLGCINVHSSLLPKYRGAAPINWAIADGARETGVTIMQMDPGMDTGPIWAQRPTPIGPEEIAPELSARLSRIGAELLSETLPVIEAGTARPVPQDDGQATYAPMLKRADGLIDWNYPASKIASRVRGFLPWPGTYTIFHGARLIVWRAREAAAGAAEDPAASRPPGAIIALGKSAITIACAGPSALLIEEVQIEGKRKVTARDFANGARLGAGDPITDQPLEIG